MSCQLIGPTSVRGFSLIELMVSITIFMVITSITLVNYPRFSNKLSLDLLGEDVALSIRQAQIFGSSVLGAHGGTGQSNIFTAYGAHFEAPRRDMQTYNYLIFADVANQTDTSHHNLRKYNGPDANGPDFPCPPVGNNNAIGPTAQNECLQKFKITGFNRVKALCMDYESAATKDERVTRCINDTVNQVSSLDIIFVRPNLDAIFALRNVAGDTVDSSNISAVGIVLESAGGEYKKTVVVWRTGQISVE